MRKLCIFEGITPNVQFTYGRIKAYFVEKPVVVKKVINCIKNNPPIFPQDDYRVFFDRASQSGASSGGSGEVIWLNNSVHYILSLNCNPDTNTIFELIAMWMLLFCSKKFGIAENRVYGNSKVIIDWTNKKKYVISGYIEHLVNQNLSVGSHFFKNKL